MTEMSTLSGIQHVPSCSNMSRDFIPMAFGVDKKWAVLSGLLHQWKLSNVKYADITPTLSVERD